ncbi:MAG TPA: cysteine--tRNA ligase [Anaerohalosphaeraceae bacterium]|nr:cysteine--tRNA ligase [Anaerohalosphaeraceae bacterium]HRT50993.1 cysteine--tRNA ligase [Anaerohalosphaeraceae bacterium]HRT86979.1 cysteine--tRNA ligase [Anaerohalosphaeraceae bacterium]
MGLKLHNTLSRKTEEFKPLHEGRVGIYVCGPTVYGHAHLGHAKSYVSFDVLVRYLRYLGYSVTYIQNITDVGHLTDDADSGEDKLAVAARREHKHPMALAEYYTASYFADMDQLQCVRPDISPRATGHIPEQIALVKTLIDKGYAYEVNGSVYFEVAKFPGYGKLSGRSVEDMQAGARVEVSPEKRHPADFALWKKAEPNHIMQWESPWGMGYPGWHLECSVMSMKYLGPTIDIHGGGIENQFPHHECEIAQSEAANGVQFVRYWLHNNMVTVNGQKMGKSLGNFITLKQLFSGQHETLSGAYDPLAVRQLILQSHYRSPIDFSDAALTAAQSGYDRIAEAVIALRKQIGRAKRGAIDASAATELERLKGRFEEAMNDDLNTAVALSVIFELVKLFNRLVAESSVTVETLQAVEDTFNRLGGDVLGIVRKEYPHAAGGDEALVDHLIGLLIQQRQEARKKKDFAAADAIRNKLAEFGIVLEDSPAGTTWRRQ